MNRKAKPGKQKSSLYYIGVSLAVMVVLGALLGVLIPAMLPALRRIQAEQRAEFEQPFLAEMKGYTANFPSLSVPVQLRGKLLAIDPVKGTIHDLFYELPRGNQAQTPAEVGVLVWMDCYTAERFDYSSDEPLAMPLVVEVEACKVTLIDWSRKAIVARRDFRGQRPPDTIAGGQSPLAPDDPVFRAAAVDREAVVDWLLSQVR
jgi:hypothetical protein